MITEIVPRIADAPPAAASPRPGRDLALGAVPALAASAATCWLLGVPTSHVAQTGFLYAALAVILWRNFPKSHARSAGGRGIGPANRITLLRAALVLPVAALVLHPGFLALERTCWWIVALAALSMSLDFLDGRVARRTGSSSAFGARFDMEVDAALLLVLSLLVWQSGKAGAWVILIGAMRYLFVAAAAVWPTLEGELPPSMRRKTVCVLQGFSLLSCLLPFVPAASSAVVAASALVALAWSFAVDVRWLARNPEPAR